MTSISKFYSSCSPVRCGGGICLCYRWHLRQREINFKGIHQLWVWTQCVSNRGPLQGCSFSKPHCLQIHAGPWWMWNVYWVMIWESFIQVTCLILLQNSMAEAKILQTFFPGCFSSCINLCLFLISSLIHYVSHLLQQMEQGLSGYSFHHLAAFIHPLIRSCLHADRNWGENKDVAIKSVINVFVGATVNWQPDHKVCVFSGSFQNGFTRINLNQKSK